MKSTIFLAIIFLYVSCSENDSPPLRLNEEFFVGTWQVSILPNEPIRRGLFIFENTKQMRFGIFVSDEGVVYSKSYGWEFDDSERHFTIFNDDGPSNYAILEFEQDEMVLTDSVYNRLTLTKQ